MGFPFSHVQCVKLRDPIQAEEGEMKMPKGFRIRDSKIAKRAIRRLIKKHQGIFDRLVKGNIEGENEL